MDDNTILIISLCIWFAWGFYESRRWTLSFLSPKGVYFDISEGKMQKEDKFLCCFIFILPIVIPITKYFFGQDTDWREPKYRKEKK